VAQKGARRADQLKRAPFKNPALANCPSPARSGRFYLEKRRNAALPSTVKVWQERE
jgi:hypothetical protein